MMKFTNDSSILNNLDLSGFFVGWPDPPTYETFKKILENSQHVVVVHDEIKLIGFINAISDGVLSAYIPLLEVRPSHQGMGLGKELVKRMLEDLKAYYMIDLSCDDNAVPFYEKMGLRKSNAMFKRNYEMQSGMS